MKQPRKGLFVVMKKFFKNNSLTIVFFLLFVAAWVAQSFLGLQQYNQEMKDEGGQQASFTHYLSTGHFMEATFENWESEFLQMALLVTLTIFLYQKGSSQSKHPGKKEPVDKEPNPKKKDAPWAVKKGGWVLQFYKNSLSYTLFLLFLLSFLLHWYGSMRQYNQQQTLKRKPTQTALQYLGNSKLWFESFENWQSEFLSVVSIVVLSTYFRQKGSPQSKPVDASNT